MPTRLGLDVLWNNCTALKVAPGFSRMTHHHVHHVLTHQLLMRAPHAAMVASVCRQRSPDRESPALLRLLLMMCDQARVATPRRDSSRLAAALQSSCDHLCTQLRRVVSVLLRVVFCSIRGHIWWVACGGASPTPTTPVACAAVCSAG
jgi:hypothetical protein